MPLVLLTSRDTIERLFGRRVEIYHLEQLNYILNRYSCEGGIVFTPISVRQHRIKFSTYDIKVHERLDINKLLFGYFVQSYNDWLAENDLGSDIPCGTIHPKFDLERSIAVPREALGRCEGSKDWDNAVSDDVTDQPSRSSPKEANMARSLMANICERIGEKERLRREAFLEDLARDNDRSKGTELQASLSADWPK